MDIKELINGLLDFNQNYEALCVENKELIAENKALKEKVERFSRPSEKVPNSTMLDNVAMAALRRGENAIFEDSICGWNQLDVRYNASEKAFQSECYQTWLKSKVFKEGIPENVSYNDFVTHFNNELHEMYEKERAEGIRKLKMDMENNKEEKGNE
jgi:hypothetical protein